MVNLMSMSQETSAIWIWQARHEQYGWLLDKLVMATLCAERIRTEFIDCAIIAAQVTVDDGRAARTYGCIATPHAHRSQRPTPKAMAVTNAANTVPHTISTTVTIHGQFLTVAWFVRS